MNSKSIIGFYITHVVLIVFAVAIVTFGQTDENMSEKSEPRDLLLADHLHGQWLTIARINHKQPGGEFNPNWTYIKIGDGIVPVIKKRGNTYYIEFTSEVTRDLP